MQLSDERIQYLKMLARRERIGDNEDDDPTDYYSGNFDDAYSKGYDDGETALARVVLAALGIDWKP